MASAGPKRTIREQLSSLAATCQWALEYDPAGASVEAHYERVLRDVCDRLLAIHREIPAAHRLDLPAAAERDLPESFAREAEGRKAMESVVAGVAAAERAQPTAQSAREKAEAIVREWSRCMGWETAEGSGLLTNGIAAALAQVVAQREAIAEHSAELAAALADRQASDRALVIDATYWRDKLKPSNADSYFNQQLRALLERVIARLDSESAKEG